MRVIITAENMEVPIPTASVTADGGAVTGTAAAGALVTLYAADGTVIGNGTAAADGSYAIALAPPRIDGETIRATQTDAAGAVSPPATALAPDLTAPAAPSAVLDPAGTVVTGRGEAGATVVVRDADGTIVGTATANARGDYAAALDPAQADGGTIAVITLPTQVLILPRLRGREPVLPQARALLAVESAPVPIPPGWPMPSLPGLAAGHRVEETPATASTPATTINGWSHQPEVNSVSPLAPATTRMTPVAPVTPVAAPVTPVATPVAPPVAPAVPVVGATRFSTGQQRQVHEDETAELPIFRAMEAVWFRSHSGADELSTSAFRTVPMPIQQPIQQPTGSATQYVPAPAAAPPVPPVATPPAPRSAGVGLPHRDDQEDLWRTAADDGWRAAAAAVQPVVSSTTRSGLPKRVPAAQLVPGAVETRPANATSRRTPEEVRGLLSAYHRGVQRGRSGEDGRSLTDQRQADKEINR